MAINENSELENLHCFVGAKTGGGKSQYMRNELVPAQGIRAIFWDVDKDHKCTRFTQKGPFVRALAAADKSGKPYRIGWSGDDDEKTFQWFCEVAWRLLNGNHKTHIILEEMADQGMGQKLPPFLRKLIVRGRKYGAVVYVTTQRCQEVPKALITQPGYRYIGLHEDHDARYMYRATGIKADDLEALRPLHFYEKGPDGVRLVSTKYRKFTA